MKTFGFIILFLLGTIRGFSSEKNNAPPYLYKVLNIQDWRASQEAGRLVFENLENMQEFYIEEQMEIVLLTYWMSAESLVIVKIDTKKTPFRWTLKTVEGIDIYTYPEEISLDAVLKAETFQ